MTRVDCAVTSPFARAARCLGLALLAAALAVAEAATDTPHVSGHARPVVFADSCGTDSGTVAAIVVPVVVGTFLLVGALLLWRYRVHMRKMDAEVQGLVSRLSKRDLIEKKKGRRGSVDIEAVLQSPIEKMIRSAVAIKQSLGSSYLYPLFDKEIRMVDALVNDLSTLDIDTLFNPTNLQETILSGHLDYNFNEEQRQWMMNEILSGSSHNIGALLQKVKTDKSMMDDESEINDEEFEDEDEDEEHNAGDEDQPQNDGTIEEQSENNSSTGDQDADDTPKADITADADAYADDSESGKRRQSGALSPGRRAAGSDLGGINEEDEEDGNDKGTKSGSRSRLVITTSSSDHSVPDEPSPPLSAIVNAYESPPSTSPRTGAANTGRRLQFADTPSDMTHSSTEPAMGAKRGVRFNESESVEYTVDKDPEEEAASKPRKSKRATGFVPSSMSDSVLNKGVRFNQEVSEDIPADEEEDEAGDTLGELGKGPASQGRVGGKRSTGFVPLSKSDQSATSSSPNRRGTGFPGGASSSDNNMAHAPNSMHSVVAKRATMQRTPTKRAGGLASGSGSFDRIGRRKTRNMGPLGQRAQAILLDIGLRDVHSWDFDIFTFADACMKPNSVAKPLCAIGYALLERYNLIFRCKIDLDVLFPALEAIEAGYHSRESTPFHNHLHGADVAQSVCCFLDETKLHMLMESHEILSIIMASLIHDYDHPGYNNQFIIASQDPLAMLYNDISVLENHHAAAGLTLLAKPQHDVFRNLSSAKRQVIRHNMITLVLATDLKHHFDVVNDFKRRAYINEARTGDTSKGLPQFNQEAFQSEKKRQAEAAMAARATFSPDAPMPSSTHAPMRTMTMVAEGDASDLKVREKLRTDAEGMMVAWKLCIKCGDLGHPAKKWDIHSRWSALIREEQINQGDKERELGLPVSAFMVRNISESQQAGNQLGFFDFLVGPMWQAFTRHFKELDKCARVLESNRDVWKTKAAPAESKEAKEAEKEKEELKAKINEERMPNLFAAAAKPPEKRKTGWFSRDDKKEDKKVRATMAAVPRATKQESMELKEVKVDVSDLPDLTRAQSRESRRSRLRARGDPNMLDEQKAKTDDADHDLAD